MTAKVAMQNEAPVGAPPVGAGGSIMRPPHGPPPAGPGRLRRVFGVLASAVGMSLLFVGALVSGILLHLDQKPVKRTIRGVANSVLGSVFQGKVVVGEIDRLNLSGISIRSIDVIDPRDQEVVKVQGLIVNADLVALGKSAAFGAGEQLIDVSLVHLDAVDFKLEKGPSGQPTIAEVFLPKVETPAPPVEVKGRPLRLIVRKIELAHAWAHGAMDPSALVDAEINHLSSSFELGPEGMKVDLDPTEIEARSPVPQPLHARTTFHLRMEDGKPSAMTANVDGLFGGVKVDVDARLEKDHVVATVGVPKVTGAQIVSLIPAAPGQPKPVIPLKVPISATVEVEGDLPNLGVNAHVGFDDHGYVGLEGKVTLGDVPRADARVIVRDVDVKSVVDLPQLDGQPIVNVTVQGRVEAGADPRVEALVGVEPFTLGKNPIPAVEAYATLAAGTWNATVTAHEPGANVVASASFDPKQRLGFDVTAEVPSFAGITRVPLPVKGAASVHVYGSLVGDQLAANVGAKLDGIAAPGGVTLSSGRVDAKVHGALSALAFDAQVRGGGLKAAGYAWETVNVKASGPLLAPRVETVLDAGGGDTITAKAAIDAASATVRDVAVVIKKKGQELDAKVGKVQATAKGIDLEGVRIDGPGMGNIHGGLQVQGKELVGHLRGENVDLGKIAQVAGVAQPMTGLANLDVDLRPAPGGRKGRVAIEMADGSVAGIEGLAGQFVASFDGSQVRTDGLFRLVAHGSAREKKRPLAERCDGTILQVRIGGGEGKLPGGLIDPAAWQRLSGKVEVAAEDLNLRCLTRLAPEALVEEVLSDVKGTLTAKLDVERAPGAKLPSIRQFLIRTRGLEVAGPIAEGKAAWESRQLDLTVKGSLDINSGETAASIALDDGSPVIEIGTKATFDLPTLMNQPAKRMASLRKTPLSAHVSIPRRALLALGTLPSFARDAIPPLDGEVQVDVNLDGTLEDPKASIDVSAWGLAVTNGPDSREASPWEIPLDLATHVKYDGTQATLDAHVIHRKQELLSAQGKVGLAIKPLLDGKAPKLTAELLARIDKLPLAQIPFLADRDVAGEVSGKIELKGLGERPEAHIDIEAPGLVLGHDAPMDHIAVKVDIDPLGEHPTPKDKTHAAAHIEVVGKDGGRVDVDGKLGMTWAGLLVPTPAGQEPANFGVTMKGFRVVAAQPFVSSILARVDGYLDGDLGISWAHFDDTKRAKLKGKLAFTKGVFNLPQLGQEFSNTTLELAISPDGSVKIGKLETNGTRGKMTATASAKLDGLDFKKAEASLSIKQGQEIPLTLEGVPLGAIRTEVRVSAEQTPKLLDVKVKVPSFHIDLPSNASRSVQALDDNPNVIIVDTTKKDAKDAKKDVKKAIAALPAAKASSPMRLEVELDQVEVLNNMLDATASTVKGKPIRVVVGAGTEVSGDIQVVRGKLEVMHKTFEVEQGLVHLRPEDPGNPYINFTAKLEVPGGKDVIFIDYIGLLLPIDTSKLKFRSATIPEDQIVATLLFGGADQQTLGSSGGAPGQQLAGQVLAQQLSTQLSNNLSTSFGTNDDGSLKPGLAYTSGNKVITLSTFEAPVGSVGGSSGASSAVGAQKTQHTQITIDWKFLKNWSLTGSLEVSDQTTTGVDVLWRYRY